MKRLFWAAALLLPMSVAATPAPRKPPRLLPGEDVELKTKDGWTLAARYAAAKPGLPTFILLHETGGRKENWYHLARAMARKGLGVLGLDLRGHGGSQRPPQGAEANWRKFKFQSKDDNEWNRMALDVEAAVEHLKGLGVAEEDVALGGADVGSSIALRYAATHKACPRIFMLSPGFSYRNVLTVNAMRAYGQRPILLAVGADDKRSMAETPILHQFAKIAAGEENVILINADREHGTRMLIVNKGLIARLVEWMENPIPLLDATISSGAIGGPPLPPPSDEETP